MPNVIVKLEAEFWNCGADKRSLKRTLHLSLLGISMPTRDLPGIGASILMGWLAKAKERLFERAVIFERLTPSAGFKVYWVTAGPILISDISAPTPKFSRVFLMIAELVIVSPAAGFPFSVSNRSKGGSLYSENNDLAEGTMAFDFSSKTGSSSFGKDSFIFGSTS